MMSLIGLLIPGLASFWVFRDARERGQDKSTAIMWSLGTFAVLVVFLPLYLIVGRKQKVAPRDEQAIDIEAVPVEEISSCPMCGNKAREDFNTCPHCGYALKPKCNQCGRELNRDWRACPYCGSAVNTK